MIKNTKLYFHCKSGNVTGERMSVEISVGLTYLHFEPEVNNVLMCDLWMRLFSVLGQEKKNVINIFAT